MLATAGTMSATIVAVFVTGAFVVSAWGFLDLLARVPQLRAESPTCPRVVGSSRWGVQ